MAGDMAINFGLLDPNAPAKAGNAFNEGYQEAAQARNQNALAQAQLKNAATQNQLQQYQLSSAQRADETANKLNSLYSSSVGPDGQINYNALTQNAAQQGLGAQIPTLQKNAIEQQKAQREADKARLEQGLKNWEVVGQIVGVVKDQASYDAARQQAAQMFGPEAVAQLPPTYDPNAVAQIRARAMTVQQQLQQEWKAKEYDLDVTKFDYQQKNDAAIRKETGRHNRATEGISAEANRIKSAEVQSGGKPPAGYRWKADGTLEAIPGGPGEKPLTDAQAKAALFGSRMESANEIFDRLERKGTTKSIPGSNAGFGIGAAINTISSSEQQQLNQAKRDFVNATLRRESGAVISSSEFDNAEKQYFPQIGDSKEVIAQKKRNRETAMRGVQAEIPKGSRGMIDEIKGSSKKTGNTDFSGLW